MLMALVCSCISGEMNPHSKKRFSLPVIIIWIAIQISRNPMIRVMAFIPVTPINPSKRPENLRQIQVNKLVRKIANVIAR